MNKKMQKSKPGILDYDFHRVIVGNVILVALYEFQMGVYNDDFEN
jgi:hypothetical protein